MAEAYGKLTGRPGICFVTRGPGATNASPGIHIAKQDSTPMILFVGQVERGMREREAFQELDYRAVFGTDRQMGDGDRRSGAHSRDRVARLPRRDDRPARPGRDRAARGHADRDGARSPTRRATQIVETHPAPDADGGAAEAAARRPSSRVAILGGSRWSRGRGAALRALRGALRAAGRLHLPPPDAVSRRSPCYAGDLGLGANPKLLARIKDADLVLLVGGRLSEIPSQAYTLLDIPAPRQTLVHVHPDPERARPRLSLRISPSTPRRSAFAAALEGRRSRRPSPPWREGTRGGACAIISPGAIRRRSATPARCRWAR